MWYFCIVTLCSFAPLLCILNARVIHKNFFLLATFFSILPSYATVAIPVLSPRDQMQSVGAQMYFFYFCAIMFLNSFIFIFFIYLGKRDQSAQKRTYHTPSLFVTLTGLAIIIFFSILLYASNGIFLTSPRYGYQHYRDGYGWAWVGYITSVSILFFFSCILKKISRLKVIFFTFLMYLTGSKAMVIAVLFKSLLLFLIQGRRFKFTDLSLALAAGLCFFKLFMGNVEADKFFNRLDSYYDFVHHASRVFEEHSLGRFEFWNGKILLSTAWGMVPRKIYPDKPYSYGTVSLVGHYYPGIAERGHTPSFGAFTHDFADFGYLGIFTALLSLGNLLIIAAISSIACDKKMRKSTKIGYYVLTLTPGFGFGLHILYLFVLSMILFPMVIQEKSRCVSI